MSDKDENEITDQQLDAMLRDIDVPADLKGQLLQIPDAVAEDSTASEPSVSRKQNELNSSPPTWLGLAIAASLIGLAVFFVMRESENTNNPGLVDAPNVEVQNDETVIVGNPTNSNQPSLSSEELKLAELQAQIDLQDALLAEIKTDQLKRQLAEVNRSIDSGLQAREVGSMIAALSSQSLIDFGGQESQVSTLMAQVIQNYPNSRGATIAQDYLKQVSN